MLSEALASSPAVVAGHETFPCFSGGKASNYEWRLSLGLSRLGLAPFPVPAGGGAPFGLVNSYGGVTVISTVVPSDK
jgi:hypothetical protein